MSLGRHPMDPAGLMKQQVEQGLVPKPGDGSGTLDPWIRISKASSIAPMGLGEAVCPGGERRNY